MAFSLIVPNGVDIGTEKKQGGLNAIAHTHVTSHFWADSPTDGCRLFHNLSITAHKIIVSV